MSAEPNVYVQEERLNRIRQDIDKMATEIAVINTKVSNLEKFKNWVIGVAVGASFFFGIILNSLKDKIAINI